MYKFINFLNYFRTLKVIYQKRISGKLSFNQGESYVKFVIVSQPRVGSTLLLSYLNSHPQIIVKDEIVRKKNLNPHLAKISIIDFLKNKVFQKYSNNIKAVGFKFFYEHKLTEPTLAAYLLLDRTIKIIHLKRKNLLRCYLSRQIAEKTELWSRTKFQKNLSIHAKKVWLDPESFQSYKEEIIQQYHFYARHFKHHDVLNIFYEDLDKNAQQQLSKIQYFLNVKNRSLVTLLDKQNPENIEDLISNYEEVNCL